MALDTFVVIAHTYVDVDDATADYDAVLRLWRDTDIGDTFDAAELAKGRNKAVERLRVEAARALLDSQPLQVEDVALETGFGDAERMRRAFIRAFGQPPQALRRGRGTGARTTG